MRDKYDCEINEIYHQLLKGISSIWGDIPNWEYTIVMGKLKKPTTSK